MSYKIHFDETGKIISIRQDDEKLEFFGEHNIIEVDNIYNEEEKMITKMIKNDQNEWVVDFTEEIIEEIIEDTTNN